ncbi:MAG: two-component sensor histidine kinase [Desulfobacteraceae bacterium]|nr:two-component sensor histidine kinase [Desulfobacteraceae bacterium]
MAQQASEEKAKPFRLVKYFTFTSLIVIFMGALVLSVLNTHLARTMLLKKSEDYAILLVENLNHQVFLQFIIPVVLQYGKIQLRKQEQFEIMDKVVRSTLHSFKVDTVNIYDVDNNIISYSFDQKMIGRKDIGGAGYRKAVAGKPSSKLLSLEKPSPWLKSLLKKSGFLLGFPQKSKIVTFAPLRAEKPFSKISGPVLGVVEIVQDISEDYEAIFRFQIRVIITCTVVMSIIFLVLRFLVNRGEGIIQRRNLERIRLKEQLNRAEHLSSLGEMIAGISHEIRNPLGIIRSSADLLKKKLLSGAENDVTTIPNIIVEESTRLNNIITDFLDYAKPKKPNPVPCRIEQILEKNINFLKSQIDDQGYAIQQHCENNLPEIMADSDMMYQAFLNILINAMQSMPDGGTIMVEISSNADIITVIFKDQGKGVPEEVKEKIWDPFFTTKETGTGLGLGIVKNIIESHMGNIRIDNVHKCGARVTIELPMGSEK